MFYCEIDKSTWSHEDFRRYSGCPVCVLRRRFEDMQMARQDYTMKFICVKMNDMVISGYTCNINEIVEPLAQLSLASH